MAKPMLALYVVRSKREYQDDLERKYEVYVVVARGVREMWKMLRKFLKERDWFENEDLEYTSYEEMVMRLEYQRLDILRPALIEVRSSYPQIIVTGGTSTIAQVTQDPSGAD